MKIAITTTNGKQVDEHFGKATSFYIYNLEGEQFKFDEIRYVNPYCENLDGEPVDPDHTFNGAKLEAVYEVIKDCDKLYTQMIGEKPLQGLLKKGIHVQPCSCRIDSLATCKGECK
jgi:predicted Fe-Mo cluster-binding NifX family protein